MPSPSLPLEPGEALLVVGSENWNPDDRTLGREHIRSVQVLFHDGAGHAAALDPLGVHGLRDVTPLDAGHVALTTGYELLRLDVGTGGLDRWQPDRTSDLHELALEDGLLLVANTAFDEGLVVATDGDVVRRFDLTAFRHASAQPIAHDRPLGGVLPGPRPVRDDHFHLNQVATGHDGGLLAVVHHVSGYRPVTHLRHRLTGHGDGGVIEIDTGRTHHLGLRAPHSLRRTHDGFAVLDSGRAEVAVLDDTWREHRRWSTGGWGRGFALAGSRWFVGVSPTRRRYLAPGEASGAAAVTCVDGATGRHLGRHEVGGVEQVWSVRVVSRELGEALVALDALHER